MVTLVPVTETNWRETLTLSVSSQQQRFIADSVPITAIALAKAHIRPFGLTWLPYAMYAEAQMVGFVELSLTLDSPSDAWVFHFFIDQRFQGKGYGINAMRALIEETKCVNPKCAGMSLVVHPENVAAQHLYTKIGFQLTGQTRWDEPEYRLAL